MNKIISIFIIIAVLALSLSSCANSDDETAFTTNKNTEAVTETIVAPTEYTLPEGEGVENLPVETVETIAENKSTVVSAESKVSMENNNATEYNTESVNTTEHVSSLEPNSPTESLSTEPIHEDSEECGCAYSAYLLMTPTEQQDYMNSFDSPLAFIDWCRTAEQEHEAHNATVEVAGGNLDVSDFID